MAQSFEELKIWKKAHEMMVKIYKMTTQFPKEELYNLTSQLRRAALSVPANIAEAYGRYHYAETAHFLFNTRGSAEEVRSLLMASRDLPQIKLSEVLFKELNNEYSGLIKGINSFISATRKKRIKKAN